MASQIVALKTAKTAPTRRPVRQAITLEAVRAITPSEAKADSMSATFGLEAVAHAAIRRFLDRWQRGTAPLAGRNYLEDRPLSGGFSTPLPFCPPGSRS